MTFQPGYLLRQLAITPPWARLLPGTSALFGPPRHWATVADYASQAGSPLWLVEPPEVVTAPRPVLFGEVDDYYVSKGAQTIPEKTVVRLRDACLYGADGSVVAAGDTFLWDTAWHEQERGFRTFRGRALFRRKRSPTRRRLAGLTAAITSDFAVGGFAHFLADALPRWRLLEAADFRASDFAHIALYHPDSATTRFLIDAAGIPAERIVPHDPSFDYECEEMVATTFPGAVPAVSAASIAWLRALAKTGRPRNRLYISRSGYRRHPANAGELEAEFARRGFASLRGDDGTAVVEACATARVTVGVEGSNLFNLCFAPVGGRVVLLLPGPGIIPYISFICQAAGLAVAIVPAAPSSPPAAPVFPLTAVRAALDWAEEAPSP